jgi:hypothetical protein
MLSKPFPTHFVIFRGKFIVEGFPGKDVAPAAIRNYSQKTLNTPTPLPPASCSTATKILYVLQLFPTSQHPSSSAILPPLSVSLLSAPSIPPSMPPPSHPPFLCGAVCWGAEVFAAQSSKNPATRHPHALWQKHTKHVDISPHAMCTSSS